ncbi:MAG: alpha-E domain-containing protein [Lachnospiraceae bacterium]
MGIVTVEKANELFWLGGYTERVYLTIKQFVIKYDKIIDNDEDVYTQYCHLLDIEDIYTSNQDFLKNYPYNINNQNSIISNLTRAYDNALVLRDEIGTETMGYIQLALYEMKKSEISDAPVIEMQHVIDYLLAFWGCADDSIEDEQSRNILKLGKRIERVDLSLRCKFPQNMIQKELSKLENRLHRTKKIQYNGEILSDLIGIVSDDMINYNMAIIKLENLVKI